MLTSLGIFLRKLRLEQREVLKYMADKLGVSASFLSAVENGKSVCRAVGIIDSAKCIPLILMNKNY